MERRRRRQYRLSRDQARRTDCRQRATTEKSLSRFSSARPRASRYQRSCPSQAAVKIRKESPICIRRQVAKRQDQLSPHARIGIVRHRLRAHRDCARPPTAASGLLACLYSTLTIFATVAAEHPHSHLPQRADLQSFKNRGRNHPHSNRQPRGDAVKRPGCTRSINVFVPGSASFQRAPSSALACGDARTARKSARARV